MTAVLQQLQAGAVETGTISPHDERGAAAGKWVLLATILGSSMAFIDGTVVNVALAALQSSLHATVSDVQWVVEAYALTLAALLLTGGSLGDLYGRRRIFTLGVALFAAASAWCGFAPDVRHLIAARALQGVGGRHLCVSIFRFVITAGTARLHRAHRFPQRFGRPRHLHR